MPLLDKSWYTVNPLKVYQLHACSHGGEGKEGESCLTRFGGALLKNSQKTIFSCSQWVLGPMLQTGRNICHQLFRTLQGEVFHLYFLIVWWLVKTAILKFPRSWIGAKHWIVTRQDRSPGVGSLHFYKAFLSLPSILPPPSLPSPASTSFSLSTFSTFPSSIPVSVPPTFSPFPIDQYYENLYCRHAGGTRVKRLLQSV